MFRIKIARRPIWENIAPKYYSAIKKVDYWCRLLAIPLNCQVHAVYIRGSCAHGKESQYSDLDIVVLVSNSSLSIASQFKMTILTLLGLYTWLCPITIKVFNIDAQMRIEPPLDLSHSSVFRKKVEKHITFDIYANGTCFSGTEIGDQSCIFESPCEFIEISKMIWGAEIKELIHLMEENNLLGEGYYHLIKKCLRLASYINFKSDSYYYGTIEECFLSAVSENKTIEKDLKFIFSCLGNMHHIIMNEQLNTFTKSIKRISEYLICHKE